MSVSCSCDWEPEGSTAVGDPREVTCRTPRKCGDCKKDINAGDAMYIWSMYDWYLNQTETPHYMCEECGDMALNLMEYGFCFNLGDSILGQWKEYLEDSEYYQNKEKQ